MTAHKTKLASRPADSLFSGGYVTVVRTLMDGTVTRERMTPFEATVELHSPQNGLTVRSLRIEWGGVLDCWSMSA